MTKRVFLGKSATFTEGKLTKVDADGTSMVGTRIDGNVCVVKNQCAHLPFPLDNGTVENGNIVCPFHNSKFSMCSGENLDWTPGVAGFKVPKWTSQLIAMGRQPAGLTTYTVDETEEGVFVEL